MASLFDNDNQMSTNRKSNFSRKLEEESNIYSPLSNQKIDDEKLDDKDEYESYINEHREKLNDYTKAAARLSN